MTFRFLFSVCLKILDNNSPKHYEFKEANLNSWPVILFSTELLQPFSFSFDFRLLFLLYFFIGLNDKTLNSLKDIFIDDGCFCSLQRAVAYRTGALDGAPRSTLYEKVPVAR